MIYQPARDKRPVEPRCDGGLLSSGKDQQFIALQAQFALNHASLLARPGMHPALQSLNLRIGEAQAQLTAAPDHVFCGLRKFLVHQPSNFACRQRGPKIFP